MPNLKPITTQNFIVTISGATGLTGTNTFSKATAPRMSRSEVPYNDGQTGTEHMTYGFSRREKLSLSKAYDPVNDATLEQWAQDALEKPGDNSDFTVTIQPVQSDIAGTPIASAKSRVFTGCQLVSMRLPDVDRTGSGLAQLELEIYYQTSTRQ
jgi:hypothetical protein